MSTHILNANTNLCDFCHQRPKFSGFSYCGKTCAAQAAMYCNYCHQKPKFGNYDFCGKNCASLAKPSPGKTTPAPPVVPKNATPNKKPTRPAAPPAVQFAPAAMAPQAPAYAPQAPRVPVAVPPPNHVPAPAPASTFIQALPQPPSYVINPAAPLPPSINTQYPTGQFGPIPEPEECLIPGCGQPVHVDGTGMRTSEYCSMRHREEAVAMGMVPPCIMCLTLPQSDVDHFCGRACREEALTKPSQDE